MRHPFLIHARILAFVLLALALHAPKTRANDPSRILEHMSREEKLGQMLTVFFEGPELSPELAEMIEEFHIGGIILYNVSGNIESPAQVARLTADAQRAAAAAGSPGLFVAVDQEGGPVVRFRDGFTVFPPNMAAAAAGIEAVRTKARVTAAELEAVGVNVNFAPVADVNVNPDNPIIGVRSYGSDPEEVSRMSAAAIEAYRDAGVVSCAKHFPGHGDTAFDSHAEMPVIPHDRKRLTDVELAPFRAAIAAGAPAVMTAHVAVPALTGNATIPATMSREVLTGILCGEMGFAGVVVTDSLGMGALDKRFGIAETAERAFAAGADVLLFGADKGHDPAEQKIAYGHLLAGLESGLLSEKLLDDAVLRILEVKREYGILDPELPDPASAPELCGAPEHRKAALDLARKSITLLRDDHGVLPVRPWQKLLVVRFGPESEPPPALDDAPVLSLPLDPGSGHVKTALAAARNVDLVLVLAKDARRRPGQAELIRKLAGPGLMVAMVGAPYDAALFPEAPCILAAYSDTAASSAALYDALYGEFRPSGRLPADLPDTF